VDAGILVDDTLSRIAMHARRAEVMLADRTFIGLRIGRGDITLFEPAGSARLQAGIEQLVGSGDGPDLRVAQAPFQPRDRTVERVAIAAELDAVFRIGRALEQAERRALPANGGERPHAQPHRG
jgi:hypothetical protein